MTDGSHGTPEQVGRTLGCAVARGRLMARQLGDRAVRERLLAIGRSAAAQHGPDAAEQAVQHAVDRAIGGVAARAGFLGPALHQLRPAAGRAAGKLARSVANRARRAEDR
jgi:hypothetical protein